MEKHSAHNPKNEGLNPAIDTEREKMFTKKLNLKQEFMYFGIIYGSRDVNNV